MGDTFLKLQEMYSFSQNVCIEAYGILNTGATPIGLPSARIPASASTFSERSLFNHRSSK